MGLVDDLAAFLAEHRRCVLLDGGVEGEWVRMRCECGAELLRRADEGVGWSGRADQL